MNMFEITEAKRESAPITAAFIGGSGSGKTYSALLFARGLVGPEGKIVVIDTEGGRSKIYANVDALKGSDGVAFHHLDFVEPYRSERFSEAFKKAISFGADCVVIDTISHEHEGFLEYADQEEGRIGGRGAKRSKWIKPKSGRKRFYSAISSSDAHVIATIRLNRIVNMDVKPAVEIMKPECDKDFPYRLDLSVELSPDHITKIIKVPEPLIGIILDGEMIGLRHGQALAADIGGQAKPEIDSAMIEALEGAADMGSEALKNAWGTSWKHAGPSETGEDMRNVTPQRAEMNKHKDRLKALAVAADQVDQEEDQAGDIGSMPDQREGEGGEGGMFGGEK